MTDPRPALGAFALLLVLGVAAVGLAACAAPAGPSGEAAPDARALADEAGPGLAVPPDTFGGYWYQGTAELTSYDLAQSRYGAVRQGEAVLIYVTEPFAPGRQVKLDDPADPEAVTVLKLNATRDFVTGIYPYHVLTSVFAPVSGAPALKVTTSVQEWCGHTFMQLNRTAPASQATGGEEGATGGAYRLRGFSYFESEADADTTLAGALPEDALWTLLRLNPDALPTGAVRLIPGTLHQRFAHLDPAVHDATAALAPDPADAALRVYTVAYPALGRTLAVRFRAAFPFEIEGWTETDRAGARTTATRRARQQLPYWELNGPNDTAARAALGLNQR